MQCTGHTILPYDQEVKLYIPVDGRSRLKDPGVPEGYFGNAVFFAICIAKAGDVIHRPIWYIASKIQESIDKMDDEYLRSSIDHLEERQGLPEPMMGGHKIMYRTFRLIHGLSYRFIKRTLVGARLKLLVIVRLR
ncbi:hypothetical protein RND81_02G110500 [Saponaria officinalis]|uniref:Uncharacterized protein n=1 Tax=Saponaria officinalis TaxID=3572 RepID=A0AAW1MSL5_SAPOF